jgi:hypothetical protein
MALRMIIAACFIVASINSASAVKKVSSPSSPSQTATRKNTYLTTGECNGLGGKVVFAEQCPGTSTACETADKNGVLRRACIDAVKH